MSVSYFESVVALLDDEAQQVVTHRQSQTEPPNYFLYSRSEKRYTP